MFPSGIGLDVYLILLVQVVFLTGYLYWVRRKNRVETAMEEG